MKTSILIYGVLTYFIGVAGLVAFIACFLHLAPFGFLLPTPAPELNSWAWNIALIALWGIVHSATARPSFKRALTKLIPEPAERPTYMLLAGITTLLLVGLWQPLPGRIWQVDSDILANVLVGSAVFGWVFLIASTFAINHFDLFGLRQVYLNFKNQERLPVEFTERLMYRFIRHPMQTGVLLGIWATPSMTTTQLLLSIGLTVYIAIGLWFEERELEGEHGDAYRSYRERTGALLPRLVKGSPTSGLTES